MHIRALLLGLGTLALPACSLLVSTTGLSDDHRVPVMRGQSSSPPFAM